jgi:acetyl esterase
MDHLSRRTFVKLAGLGAAAAAIGAEQSITPALAAAAPQLHGTYGALLAAPDAQMQAVLAALMALGVPPLNTLLPRNAREMPSATDAVLAVATQQDKPCVEPVARVHHEVIQGPGGQLVMRVYTPAGSGPFPVLVYFHGGGWVIANLNVYDGSCRALTNAAGAVVVSVAYRQAPEFKFPAAPQDAFAAYQWVVNNAAKINGDPDRIAVGGESAGGNLATVTAMQARNNGVRMPIHQLLVYPVTNYAFDTPSYQENADAKPLNRPLMMWFWGHYLRSAADGQNPLASPLRAQNLRGLPPATVITAEIDPLRDEGEAYANRLREAGVAVTSTRYMGVAHEFFGMAAVLDKAKQAVMEAAMGLRAAYGTAPAMNMAQVPNVIGLSMADAQVQIENAGLAVSYNDMQGREKLGDLFDQVAPGTVVSSLPAPSAAVARGSGVTLGVRAP